MDHSWLSKKKTKRFVEDFLEKAGLVMSVNSISRIGRTEPMRKYLNEL
jgi:hypothetical protein